MLFYQHRIPYVFYSSNGMGIDIVISRQEEKIPGNMRFCTIEGIEQFQLFVLDHYGNRHIKSRLKTVLPVLCDSQLPL